MQMQAVTNGPALGIREDTPPPPCLAAATDHLPQVPNWSLNQQKMQIRSL